MFYNFEEWKSQGNLKFFKVIQEHFKFFECQGNLLFNVNIPLDNNAMFWLQSLLKSSAYFSFLLLLERLGEGGSR